MNYARANNLDFDPRPQLSRIFVEGFYIWLKSVNKDKAKLTRLFTHMFDLSLFYVAYENGQIAAMAACTGGLSPVKLDRKQFTQVLGWLRGIISYVILKRHMMNNNPPFTLSPETGLIEFVATAPEYVRKGYCRALLSYVMDSQPFDAYMLEVAENNFGAMALYEKLGFKEIKRVSAPKRSGVGAYVYMRRSWDR